MKKDIGEKNEVSCVKRENLVRNVIRNVNERMVKSDKVRMVVEIERKVGKGRSEKEIEMRNYKEGIVDKSEGE